MINARKIRARGDAAHLRFRSRSGSEFIASGFAIGQIQELIERRRPAALLELGAGIGTLTAAFADVVRELPDDIVYVAVEEEAFCRDQLRRNLAEYEGSFDLQRRVGDVPSTIAFDLVVIDGGATTDLLPADRHRWTAADERVEMQAVLDHLAPGALVVFENQRDPQRRHLEALATRPWVHERVRPLDASSGYHLYWFEPKPATRLLVPVRERLRSLWFPKGVRLWRRLYRRVTGRIRPERDTVATGGGPDWE